MDITLNNKGFHMKSQVKLLPHPDNPRIITDDQKEKLGKSMHEFGDLSGIVLNKKDGYLIAGHQRIQSLIDRYGDYTVEITEKSGKEQRGFVEPEHIAIRIVSWDQDKAKAARIAANAHGGDWDFEKLNEQLLELHQKEFDIDLTGFDVPEIRLFNAGHGEKEIDENIDTENECPECGYRW